MKNLITISEMAKLAGISVHTLRYYDKKNILTPEIREENTKYRYYTGKQIGILDMIIRLRNLNFSLDFIKKHLDNLDFNYTLDLINERISENHIEIANLIAIEKNLKNQKKYFSELLNVEEKVNKQFIETFKSIQGILIEENNELDIPARMIESFKKGNEIFDGKNWRLETTFGLIIDKESILDQTFKKYNFFIFKEKKDHRDTYCLKGGKYACMYVKGKVDFIKDINSLTEWVEKNDYEIDGDGIIEFKTNPGIDKSKETSLRLIKIRIK